MTDSVNERLERDEAGGSAFFDAEFFEDVFEVFFHRAFGDAENEGGLGIGFALGDPEENFGFPGGKSEGAQRGDVGEIGLPACKLTMAGVSDAGSPKRD